MYRRYRLALLLVAAAISLAIHINPTRAQVSPDLDAIDQFLEEQLAANRIPGAAVAITHGDEILFLKGYGTAGNNQAVTPQTQFYIASLSKSFTALAVMQLVEAGQVDLDTPVQTYLPKFTLADAEATSRITVRQFLNQLSGLSDLGFPAMTLPQPISIEERIATLSDARLVSEPGTEFHYINENYGVLARLVEVVSGESFGDFLQTHIFTPLHMTNTISVVSSAETPSLAPNLAQGHILAFSLPIAWNEMIGYLGGSGGLISTAEDMANYLIMQNSGGQFEGESLVSPESITLMHTPPSDVDSPYAMGWMVLDENASPRVVEHNGILSTFHSEAALLPDDGYGIVLLYNLNNLLINYDGIKNGLITLLLGQQPTAGGLSAGTIGLIVAVVTLITLLLQIRALLRLPKWAQRTHNRPLWRLIPGLVWAFVPTALFLALPTLTAQFGDRVFSYEQHFTSFPDIFIWLALTALLGALIGIAHLIILLRRWTPNHSD